MHTPLLALPACRPAFAAAVARCSLVAALALSAGCGEPRRPAPQAQEGRASTSVRPSLLLVTLDTTRADAVAPEGAATVTPTLAALSSRALRFTQAYATAPTTLPAHASMMTGLYPAGHGVHENGRRLGDDVPVVAERLREFGYATAAPVSGYPLERQFGLARGFDLYDDAIAAGLPEGHASREVNERGAAATTARALAWLAAVPNTPGDRPLFLWVHYYDPHDPYSPPEPFRSRFPDDPYRGEIAAMDHELGRLLAAFEQRASRGGWRALVLADHGEGRGDHGESLHGHLLYQGVMRVPLLAVGSGLAAGERTDPVSIRQVRATLLGWAGEETAGGLLAPAGEPVLGEAMQPFLNYRWQPQTMAVAGRYKLIRSGRLELYDVVADAAEAHDLAASTPPDRALARAVADYPLPSRRKGSAAEKPVDDEERRRLASLGYLVSEGAPTEVPADAPRAAEMTALFSALDEASRNFVAGRYREVIPILEGILRRDPGNVMAAVRLAASHSLSGHDEAAMRAFSRALAADPRSLETSHYLALHHLRQGRFEIAGPLFEQVLAEQPDRLPAIEGLSRVRMRQRRSAEAAALLDRAVPLSRDPAPLLVELGGLRMEAGETEAAIAAFEQARERRSGAFAQDLELGVLYLAAQRLPEAREALDRVPLSHPAHALALFKRAQVAVLLAEPDRAERVRAAWLAADAETRPLLASERLFEGLLPR